GTAFFRRGHKCFYSGGIHRPRDPGRMAPPWPRSQEIGRQSELPNVCIREGGFVAKIEGVCTPAIAVFDHRPDRETVDSLGFQPHPFREGDFLYALTQLITAERLVERGGQTQSSKADGCVELASAQVHLHSS